MESKSKNVLLITSEFPPGPGGIGSHAYNLAKFLHQESYNVTVLTDLAGDLQEDIKTFDRNQLFSIVRIKRTLPLLYFNRIRTAYKLARDNSSGVLILSGKFSIWVGALLRASSLQFRSYVVLHGSEVHRSNIIIRWVTHRSILSVDGVISVSNYTQGLISNTILKRKRHCVIPNGIDKGEYNVDSSKRGVNLRGNPSLLTIGNLTKRKGQHNVINAIPLLRVHYPEIHYHTIGIPTTRKELEKLAKSLDVEKHITFHGKIVDRNMMLQLAREASLFIMLSEKQKEGGVEGYGIAILEANMLGVPAIGARGSGIEDAINNGVNGLLIDGSSPEEVLRAIQTILSEKERFAEAARIWALQHSWENLVHRYIDFITK